MSAALQRACNKTCSLSAEPPLQSLASTASTVVQTPLLLTTAAPERQQILESPPAPALAPSQDAPPQQGLHSHGLAGADEAAAGKRPAGQGRKLKGQGRHGKAHADAKSAAEAPKIRPQRSRMPAPAHSPTPAAAVSPGKQRLKLDYAHLRRLKKGDAVGLEVQGFQLVIGGIRGDGKCDLMWRWTPDAACPEPAKLLRSAPERDRWLADHAAEQRPKAGLPRQWKQIEAASNGAPQPLKPRRVLKRQADDAPPPPLAQDGHQADASPAAVPTGPLPVAGPSSGVPNQHAKARLSGSDAAEQGQVQTAALFSGSTRLPRDRRHSASGRPSYGGLKPGDPTGAVLDGFEKVFLGFRPNYSRVFFWRRTDAAWAPEPPSEHAFTKQAEVMDWLKQHDGLKAGAQQALASQGMLAHLSLSLSRHLDACSSPVCCPLQTISLS